MPESQDPVQDPGQEPAVPAKPKKPGTFQKGGDPRQAQLIEEAKKRLLAEQPAPKEVPLPELVPVEGEGMLRAFRHVLMNDDPRHDTEPLFKLAREIRSEDRRAFGKQFADLERAEREASAAKVVEKAADRTADAGTAKARGLIDRLLSKAAEAAELEVQT
jgi:hypothetical protein